MKIQLTQGKYATVDDIDYKYLSLHKWCIHNGYAVRRMPNEGSRLLYMHRVICKPIEEQQVDHVNMNRLDNRRENLRVVSKSENMRNRTKQSNNTSGYKGVSLDKRKSHKKWRVNIRIDGKDMGLGYFVSQKEAAIAYNSAAIKYHGQFARINEL